MTTGFGHLTATGRAVAKEARRQDIPFLSAGISYYAFVSIFPAMLLAVSIASFVGGEALEAQVSASIRTYLSPAAWKVVEEVLTNPSGRGGATVVGALVFLWSTLKVFRGLDDAFSQIYDVNQQESFVEKLADAGTVFAVIGVAAGAMLVVEVLLGVFAWLPYAELVSAVVLLAALVPVFLPLYYFFPDAGVTLPEAVPGAVFSTVGWTALQVGFQMYVDTASPSLYNLLGGALLLVTWLYVGGIVLLLGAVVNVVLAEREPFRKTKDLPEDKERQQRYRREHMNDDTDQSAPNILDLRDDLQELQAEVEEFEQDVDERTVKKPELESELKQYVRARMRRGHARGWGPYLVLLYGTAMTLGAFRWLDSGWAIAAMVVVWLSTLGLYTLMVLVGAGVSAVGIPGRVVRSVRNWRS